jgi:hypothetical protein
MTTRPFLPPPDPDRCCAAAWSGYYMARCPYRRAPGSDVCEAHRAVEAKGRSVRRVKRPARVEVSR